MFWKWECFFDFVCFGVGCGGGIVCFIEGACCFSNLLTFMNKAFRAIFYFGKWFPELVLRRH